MQSPTVTQAGIKRAWRIDCKKENINPQTPKGLTLLFAIDDRLNIADGFRYSLNCNDKSSPYYGSGFCAGHIGCASDCASGTDCATSGSKSDGTGDSDGCSGGCGGD